MEEKEKHREEVGFRFLSGLFFAFSALSIWWFLFLKGKYYVQTPPPSLLRRESSGLGDGSGSVRDRARMMEGLMEFPMGTRPLSRFERVRVTVAF